MRHQPNPVNQSLEVNQSIKGETEAMSLRKIFTTVGTTSLVCMTLSVFALFVGTAIVFGSASAGIAQEGNKYEEPWHPAARFAVSEGGKKEKATITLVKVEKADFQTGEEGLTFQICLAVDVQKGHKKAVRRYARTTVFRNDKISDQAMAYSLKSWKLSKTLPSNCH
jgi:hypothetical protein